ncbi:MAG: hypothetical protein IPN90_12945 [Elusimicrobia bacterium]|nr:hypothetical protein [Elusimicrobiota bacterium]
MTANSIYTITGDGTGALGGDGGLASSARVNSPYGVSVDVAGNVSIADYANYRARFIPTSNKTYFGQARTANYIYTIAGGGASYGENALATGKTLSLPQNIYAGADHMIYLADTFNSKVRMVTGEDFISPSTSTLAATTGIQQVTLNWNSAGDDMVTLGNLTGNYRIQYATYTASWSTSSTPSNATTVTISTTNATPGSAQSYTATGLTGGSTYYFVLWTGDEVPNWSDVSNTASVLLTPSVPSTVP